MLSADLLTGIVLLPERLPHRCFTYQATPGTLRNAHHFQVAGCTREIAEVVVKCEADVVGSKVQGPRFVHIAPKQRHSTINSHNYYTGSLRRPSESTFRSFHVQPVIASSPQLPQALLSTVKRAECVCSASAKYGLHAVSASLLGVFFLLLPEGPLPTLPPNIELCRAVREDKQLS